MEQQQKQGDRRQSQTQYQGEDRRKHTPVSSGMTTQDRKDEQAERVRQQRDQHDDIH